jgi:hypothetical protein
MHDCRLQHHVFQVLYATLQVTRGRPAVGRMNGQEPLSRYAQVGNGSRFERRNSEWINKLAEDKRASAPDQVAAKLARNDGTRSPKTGHIRNRTSTVGDLWPLSPDIAPVKAPLTWPKS